MHVICARSKKSAFLEKLIRDTRWLHVTLVAGICVAEAGYLAKTAFGIHKKLKVIDIGVEDGDEGELGGLSSSPFCVPTSTTLMSTGKALAVLLPTKMQATKMSTATGVR